jgi:hypothetical protein
VFVAGLLIMGLSQVAVAQEFPTQADLKKGERKAEYSPYSLHGSNGHTHLRDGIAASYGVLLDVHPALASYVAKDLLAWRRWDFTGILSKILAALAPPI